jgi:hypothetical protein
MLLASSLVLPLFLFNVAWFLPLALLPRGVLSELLVRRLPAGRTSAESVDIAAQEPNESVAFVVRISEPAAPRRCHDS